MLFIGLSINDSNVPVPCSTPVSTSSARSTQSPRTPRATKPLRSVENTAPPDYPMIMVCSETVHDTDSRNHVESLNSSQNRENSITHTMVRQSNCHKVAPCILPQGKDKDSWCRIRTEPFTNHYTVEDTLGRGKFAVVKRCCHKVSGRQYAAKFLRKRRKGQDCRAVALQEVKMLELALLHPRLVDMIEVFETSHEIIIITEYAAGGELFQRVLVNECCDEAETRRLLRQVIEGVHFLHERSIVHLDIKPQNILLTHPGPTTNVKLCDLGFARHIDSGDDIRDIIGTPDYVAPEILSYEPIHSGSDMWSLGVLAYVMLTGFSPFAGDTKQETFLNISQVNLDFPADLFSHISGTAVEFITGLLRVDPRDRMTAKECLKHPWLQLPPTTPAGSPAGQRRALTPSSPDTTSEEPNKKCRCDESPSTSSSCESCTELPHESSAVESVVESEAQTNGIVEPLTDPLPPDTQTDSQDNLSSPHSVSTPLATQSPQLATQSPQLATQSPATQLPESCDVPTVSASD